MMCSKAYPWLEHVRHAGIELAIARVAQYQSVGGVKQDEAFPKALERVDQPLLAGAQRLAGPLALDHPAELSTNMRHDLE